MQHSAVVSDVPGDISQSPEVLMTSSESEQALRWKRCTAQLRLMMTLPDNWDGFGAEAPRHDVLALAFALVDVYRWRDAPPPSRIVASPSGSVVIERHWPGGYGEVEIEEPYVLQFMLSEHGKPNEHWEERLHPERLVLRSRGLVSEPVPTAFTSTAHLVEHEVASALVVP